MHYGQLLTEYLYAEADELTRRLFNSLRGRDPKKFTRKIKQLKESQDKKDE